MKNIIEETPNVAYSGRLLETFNFIDINDFKKKIILDIGCGYGWFEKKILEFFPKKIVASEYSDEDLLTIKKYLVKESSLSFKKANAINLPFNNNTFDTVVAWEVIEHIPKNTENRMFSEVYRVLKENGTFYLSTPYKGLFSTLLDPAWWLIGHRHYNEYEFMNLASANNFFVEKISIKGGYWSILAILNLYFSKWILHRKPIFSDIISKKINEEFLKFNKGSVNLFIKFKKKHV